MSSDADRKAVRTEMRALRSQRRPLLNSAFTTELKSCPRIVDFYGSVVRENGNACIAVEYVAGGSLSSWLDSGCKCPEAWIAHIAHQALEVISSSAVFRLYVGFKKKKKIMNKVLRKFTSRYIFTYRLFSGTEDILCCLVLILQVHVLTLHLQYIQSTMYRGKIYIYLKNMTVQNSTKKHVLL